MVDADLTLSSKDSNPLIDGRGGREAHAESLDVDERERSEARAHVGSERYASSASLRILNFKGLQDRD